MSQTPPRLTLTGISKRYPSVVANDGVSLSVAPGEIHAILGENGAGKSTLMKIIYGAVKADAGEIRWNGQPVTIANPAQARKLGIGMVFQHFSLFETLTVVENIALALDAPFDPAALALRVREVSERYGLPLDPHRLVHSLSVGERQRVEIVRCLLQDPKLLILDEPTSVLTPQAVQKLFDTLRRLASEGVSIVYISHKLHEIQTLCDSATILRGGKVTGEAIPRDETPASLARMMIGRELPVCEAPPYSGPSRPVLEIRQLSQRSDDPFGTSLTDVSLTVNAGRSSALPGFLAMARPSCWRRCRAKRPAARPPSGWMAKRLAICTLAADARAGWPLCRKSGWGAARCPRNRWRITPCSPATVTAACAVLAWSAMRARASLPRTASPALTCAAAARWRPRVRCPAAICKNSLSGARSCSARKP